MALPAAAVPGLLNIGASLLGGLGTETRQQTATNAPWQAIQPQVLGAIQGATPLLGQPRGYYPGSTQAQTSPFTVQGIQGIAGQAMQPTATNQARAGIGQAYSQPQLYGNAQAANAYRTGLSGGMQTMGGNLGRASLANTLSGPSTPMVGAQQVSTSQQNPYLDNLFNQGADQIQSRLSSQFASGGRLNSGAYQRAFAQQLSNAANQIYGAEASRQADRNLTAQQANQRAGLQAGMANQSAFLSGRGQQIGAANSLLGDERFRSQIQQGALGQAIGDRNSRIGNINQAAGLAPRLDAASYMPWERMVQAGALDQSEQQRFIDADRQRYDHNVQEPWSRIADYLGLIGYGNTPYGTSSQPIYRDNTANFLGSAAANIPDIIAAFRDQQGGDE